MRVMPIGRIACTVRGGPCLRSPSRPVHARSPRSGGAAGRIVTGAWRPEGIGCTPERPPSLFSSIDDVSRPAYGLSPACGDKAQYTIFDTCQQEPARSPRRRHPARAALSLPPASGSRFWSRYVHCVPQTRHTKVLTVSAGPLAGLMRWVSVIRKAGCGCAELVHFHGLGRTERHIASFVSDGATANVRAGTAPAKGSHHERKARTGVTLHAPDRTQPPGRILTFHPHTGIRSGQDFQAVTLKYWVRNTLQAFPRFFLDRHAPPAVFWRKFFEESKHGNRYRQVVQ